MTAERTMARPGTLRLVDELATVLGEAQVSYCHWKSNEALDRSLAGENDLDLLIERAHLLRFLEIASRLGFRLALPAGGRQEPGHLSLYGLDRDTGRLVQIDAQTRLVLGDDMTKNYRLPVEREYLREVDTSRTLPVPRPEFEYLLFVVRMVLKHCPWDAQLSYKARLTASEDRELIYLEERVDPAQVERLRTRHLPCVPLALWQECRRALGRELPPWSRAGVARRLARALEGHDRRSPGLDTALKLLRRATHGLQRRFSPGTGGKRPAAGGLVIAVVGGDGSGKTSTVEDLESFLRRHFATRRIHLGKPRPSFSGRLLRAALRRVPDSGVPAGSAPWVVDRLGRFPGYRYMLVHLLTARDRYRTHRRARRAANRGAVVVCDRFPLAGLETMDCPRLQRLSGMGRRAVAVWMKGKEADYYRRLHPPDAVIVLKVSPDVAVSRRPDQAEEFVRRRAAEIHDRDWKEPNVFVIDAGRPREDVRQEARAVVWSLL